VTHPRFPIALSIILALTLHEVRGDSALHQVTKVTVDSHFGESDSDLDFSKIAFVVLTPSSGEPIQGILHFLAPLESCDRRVQPSGAADFQLGLILDPVCHKTLLQVIESGTGLGVYSFRLKGNSLHPPDKSKWVGWTDCDEDSYRLLRNGALDPDQIRLRPPRR